MNASTSLVERRRPLRSGLPIAANRDHAGALGCVVHDAGTRRPLLLSAHHVLWEPRSDGTVWQPGPCGAPDCDCNVVGRTVRGKRSIVRWQDHWYYIDAAVAAIEDGIEWETGHTGSATAAIGTVVRKVGPGTGPTEGVVVDERHVDRVRFGSFHVDVPNQIRIRPLGEHARFAADGDSGAVVADEHGRVVGLLWGADAEGVGVACPIGPILEVLEISLPGGET